MTIGLELTRSQILTFRRRAASLDERLPRGQGALRRAAWAGLQDSMPRAALLSIHARMAGTEPETWEDPSLVQIWGPRFSAYVVAKCDRAVFTLGRLPSEAGPRTRAGYRRAVAVGARGKTDDVWRCGTRYGCKACEPTAVRRANRNHRDPLGWFASTRALECVGA